MEQLKAQKPMVATTLHQQMTPSQPRNKRHHEKYLEGAMPLLRFQPGR
jgi:hypothetical protein